MALQQSNLKDTWVDTNPFHFHAKYYKKSEKAQNIVLISGLGGSSRYLVPLGECLSSFYNVYIPDLPGFGKTSKPDYIFDIEELANALYLFIEVCGIKDPILLGSSFGCQIVVEYTIHYPKNIRAIILAGPTIEDSKRTVWQQLKGWLKNAYHEPPTLSPLILKDYLDCGFIRLIRTFFYALSDQIEKKISQIKVPVLIIRGEKDRVISFEWAKKLAAMTSNGHLVTIPRKGHTVIYNAPYTISNHINRFLQTALSPPHFQRRSA